MTPPPTLEEVSFRYRQIAQDPEPESPGAAWDLERSLIVTGLRRLALAAGRVSPADVEAACAAAAGALLMDWLRRAHPETATVKAAVIARAWADGGELAKLLGDLARVTGVDVGEVTRLAEAEAAIRAGRLTQRGGLADAPECQGCGTGQVAVPGAGAFGYFCEDCIALCHAGQDENHVCGVCSAAEAVADLAGEGISSAELDAREQVRDAVLEAR
jgi:hypothetical protein